MSEQAFDIAISQAWQDAGRDLGIRVTAPFILTIEGRDVAIEALVSDFGGPMGAIAVGSETSCFSPSLNRLGIFRFPLIPNLSCLFTRTVHRNA
jgi:hypothetical protein